MTILGYIVYTFGLLIMLSLICLTYQQIKHHKHKHKHKHKQNQETHTLETKHDYHSQPNFLLNLKNIILNKIKATATQRKTQKTAKQATKQAAKQAATASAQQIAQLKNQNYIAYILKPSSNKPFPIVFLKKIFSYINIHPLCLNQPNPNPNKQNQGSLKRAVFQAYDSQQQPAFQILNLQPHETFDLQSYANNKIEGLVFLLELNQTQNKKIKNKKPKQTSGKTQKTFAHMLSVIYEVQKKIGGEIMTEHLQPVTINCIENTYDNLPNI